MHRIKFYLRKNIHTDIFQHVYTNFKKQINYHESVIYVSAWFLQIAVLIILIYLNNSVHVHMYIQSGTVHVHTNCSKAFPLHLIRFGGFLRQKTLWKTFNINTLNIILIYLVISALFQLSGRDFKFLFMCQNYAT